MTKEKVSQMLSDNLADEKKLQRRQEQLSKQKRDLQKSEDQFEASIDQSLSHLQVILDNYASSPSAQAFYYDFLPQVQGIKRAVLSDFDDDYQEMAQKSRALENKMRELYEERQKLRHTTDQVTSKEKEERHD